MTEYIWPAIAAFGLALTYRVVMRWLGNAPRYDVKAINDHTVRLRADFDAHVKTWDLIGSQWRQKVVELEQKCERVVVDAKNEIAGDLASVQNITSKGWR